MDASGNLFISDYYNSSIRLVSKKTGIVTTYAGTGNADYSGDGGAATSANLSYPSGVAVDANDNVYVADTTNGVIRLITGGTSIITTYAGTGNADYSGDGGAATSADLNIPYGVTLGSTGNLFIADTFNHRIRLVIKSTGIIRTYAGNGTAGYSGDGGVATLAGLYYPTGVAVDVNGNLYIADYYNNIVRLVTKSTGIITSYAGNGNGGYSGDGGVATSAELYGPWGVTLDIGGNLFIADTFNGIIRLVTKSSGIIITYAGNGTLGYSGDGGAATLAGLSYPYDVAVDTSGNVFIADTSNQRIRLVSPAVQPTPKPTTVPTPLPTPVPTKVPTAVPTAVPTKVPTTAPTTASAPKPSFKPSVLPTIAPTTASAPKPSFKSTSLSTTVSVSKPSIKPTALPTIAPTLQPSIKPTTLPPTAKPTVKPTTAPPTTKPTVKPTTKPPTTKPAVKPTVKPT